MSLNELLPELLKLNRDEMVEAIEILQDQIAKNDMTRINENTVYEAWSPAITSETARILQEVLQEDKERRE